MPRIPSSPAKKPADALPRQERADLEDDAALFRQSLGEEKTPGESRPGARHAGPEHGAETRYRPGATGARRPESHEAAAHHHEHGAAGVHEHGAAGAHEHGAAGAHEHGAAGAQRHGSGTADATQERQATNRPDPEIHKAGATARDDAAPVAEADDKDSAELTETGRDLHRFMAMQETRSHEIAAQKAGDIPQPVISQDLVDKVADRILVSVGRDGQDREVRILVKDSVLQDTEVSLKYEQGDLVVNFITQSAADNALLNNSSQALKTALEKALDGGVRINVSAGTDDAGHSGDDRRSRGMYIDEEES